MSAAVEVRGVRRTFGSQPPAVALDGVDLTVAAGSLTAVLGPSGSGKTTLLRVLAGTERPDEGTVQVGDVLVDGPGRHVVPERRRVGLVPQDGALFPHLDVAGNIGFGLQRRQRADRDARVADLLGLVGMAGMQRRRIHQLSGGQQQRIALARALAPEPDVVLLDEPFSALDASLRSSLRDEVADLLRAAGTTAVLVTHDQDEALSIADSVAVLRDGRIVQHAGPDELYRRPRDLWVADFLGDAVVLDGELLAGDRSADGPRRARCALGTVEVDLPDVGAPDPGPVSVFCRPEQVWPVGSGTGGSSTVGSSTVGSSTVGSSTVGSSTVGSSRVGAAATVVRRRFAGADVVVDLDVAGVGVTARWPAAVAAAQDASVDGVLRVAVVGRATAFRSAAQS